MEDDESTSVFIKTLGDSLKRPYEDMKLDKLKERILGYVNYMS
jgi:hypothetical protein